LISSETHKNVELKSSKFEFGRRKKSWLRRLRELNRLLSSGNPEIFISRKTSFTYKLNFKSFKISFWVSLLVFLGFLCHFFYFLLCIKKFWKEASRAALDPYLWRQNLLYVKTTNKTFDIAIDVNPKPILMKSQF
jgi:hypothetical protein